MTLRVYTDVTGMQPKTRMGGLLATRRGPQWAPVPNQPEVRRTRQRQKRSLKLAQIQALQRAGATGQESSKDTGLRFGVEQDLSGYAR
jgi:hypothetical protein